MVSKANIKNKYTDREKNSCLYLVTARQVATLIVGGACFMKSYGTVEVCISMVHHRASRSTKRITSHFIQQVSSLSTRTDSQSITSLVTNESLQGLEQVCSTTFTDATVHTSPLVSRTMLNV